MAQKVENNQYTKAQAYFLDVVCDEKKQDSTQVQLSKAMIDIKAQIMGTNDVNGVTIEKNKETTTFVICAKVGKNYNKWDPLPAFLKEMEVKPTFQDANLRDCFNIVDKEGKMLNIDGKDILFIVTFEPIEIASLKQPTNHIEPTNKHGYSNYTQAKSYFIESNQDENKQAKSVKKVAIEMRGQIMGLKGVVGVCTQKFQATESLVICARVGKDFNLWQNIPKFLKPTNNPPKIESIDLKAVFNILDEQTSQPVKIDEKEVLLFVVAESNDIASLNSPQNKISSNKIHNYEKKGKAQQN